MWTVVFAVTTYAVQMYPDGALRVEVCGLAVQRRHFADYADGLMHERFEIARVDARGGFAGHGCAVFWFVEGGLERFGEAGRLKSKLEKTRKVDTRNHGGREGFLL